MHDEVMKSPFPPLMPPCTNKSTLLFFKVLQRMGKLHSIAVHTYYYTYILTVCNVEVRVSTPMLYYFLSHIAVLCSPSAALVFKN